MPLPPRDYPCPRSRSLFPRCSASPQVDRTELNLDTSWAETGDRYMLKLFRDFMFHQVDSYLVTEHRLSLQVMEDGRPFLDMAHVITSLNRLDAGIPDKVTPSTLYPLPSTLYPLPSTLYPLP